MFELLLGHLAGDYLLQNDWMARNKTRADWTGWLSASVHCIIYTLAVCLFMQNFQPIWMLIVFLSHFPIDKFGLAELYMKHVKGYNMKQFLEGSDYPSTNRMTVLRGGFMAFIYAVTDNTMHLILMWGAHKLIY